MHTVIIEPRTARAKKTIAKYGNQYTVENFDGLRIKIQNGQDYRWIAISYDPDYYIVLGRGPFLPKPVTRTWGEFWYRGIPLEIHGEDSDFLLYGRRVRGSGIKKLKEEKA